MVKVYDNWLTYLELERLLEKFVSLRYMHFEEKIYNDETQVIIYTFNITRSWFEKSLFYLILNIIVFYFYMHDLSKFENNNF